MRAAFTILILLGSCFLHAFAQEGHPLTGTWHGQWAPGAGQSSRLVLFMKWDTKKIEGSINPGPKAVTLTDVTLDPEKWTVHLEGDGKDADGHPVHISADGKLDDIGSYNRTMTGTWTQGNQKGEFKVTRD